MGEYITRKIHNIKNKKQLHKYYDQSGALLTNKKDIDNITKGVYIPPAYDNVKIYVDKSSKVLAIGTDNKDRKQYIYNKDFVKDQANKKFDHMISFGKSFTKINKKINEDFNSVKENKEKQVAIILKLIMECHFRVGNDRYSKKNKSYGTTTLEKKHLKINKDNVTIDFIGKKSVRNSCSIKNKRMIKTLKNKRKTLSKNDRLFSYRKGEKYYNIKSSDVNNYLKQFGKFTAKNFRTWGANIEFILQVLKFSKKGTKNVIKDSINLVSKRLHNTYSVCKSNYIDPELVNYYETEPEEFIKYFKINGSANYNKEDIYKKYVYFLEDL